MSARIIDSRTAKQLPWKNGQGVTLELAIAPPGAGLHDFDWRISSAKVANAGAFSLFPGIDRSLGLLSGEGLRLELPEHVTLRLDRHNPIQSFPGELAIQAELLGGAVCDFNLMTRRGRWQQRLEYRHVQGEELIDGAARVFIYCQQATRLSCTLPSGAQLHLSAGQGLLLEDESGPYRLSSAGDVAIFLAWLDPL
jgi:environmental stress-induced protein Ves